MSIEERVVQLEKQMQFYKRLVIVLALVIVAGVTMGQTSDYEDVMCRSLNVVNDQGKVLVGLFARAVDGNGMLFTRSSSGETLVALGAASGGGFVSTYSPSGKPLVGLGATGSGEGALTTYSPSGKDLVYLGATVDGHGMLATYSPSGKDLVTLGATVDGGAMVIYNKTDEQVINLYPDEYGNGRIGVYNRKGKGRVYDSQ
jgi:hypothetical protein